MNTAVLIPCWNGSAHLRRCLGSIFTTPARPGLVLIVDDASTDDSLSVIAAMKAQADEQGVQLRVIQNSRNLGFTRTANVGLQTLLDDAAGYDMAVLLNQDTAVQPGWLAALQSLFEQGANIGVAGCKIYYPDGAILQHAGGCLVRPRMTSFHYGHHQPDNPEFGVARDVDFVTGAAMALRVESLCRVGIFNEVFSPGYYEDVDLCVRMQENGWRVVYNPAAVVQHVESASFTDWSARLALSQRNRILFALRWMDDPVFYDAFEGAERAFTRAEADASDLRALTVAYASVMLMLPTALRLRLPARMKDKVWAIELINRLADLREEALRRIRQLS